MLRPGRWVAFPINWAASSNPRGVRVLDGSRFEQPPLNLDLCLRPCERGSVMGFTFVTRRYEEFSISRLFRQNTGGQIRARPSPITHKALFHDVRRRASSRPCQMAKAPTARIVIVIAMILSLLIDTSCAGRGSFIVVSSLSWVSRESGSRHSNHEVAGCPRSVNEGDFLHLTSVTRQIYPVSNLACCASTITQ